MKKLTLCLGFSLLTLCSFAQIQIAVTGGIHGASVSPNFLVYPDTAKNTAAKTTGIEFGLLSDVLIWKNFFFRSGVILSTKGSNLTQTYDTTNLVAKTLRRPENKKNELLSYNTKLRLTYIDVPLNLAYKFTIKNKTKFMIGGGPKLSLLFNGHKDLSTINVSQQPDSEVQLHYIQEINTDLPIGKLPERYRILHFGANAFAGLEFGRIYVTANYGKSLNEFYEEVGRKYKHETFGAAIGIYFSRLENKNQ